MGKPRFSTTEGQFDNKEYQAYYRQNNPNKVALWRLHTALNAVGRHPDVLADALAALKEFTSKHGGGADSEA